MLFIQHDVHAQIAQRNSLLAACRHGQQLLPFRNAKIIDIGTAVGVLLHHMTVHDTGMGDTCCHLHANPDRALMQIGTAS